MPVPEQMGVPTRVDTQKVPAAAEEVARPFIPRLPYTDRAAITQGFTTAGQTHRFGDHGHDGVNGATSCGYARRGVGSVLGAIRDGGCGVSGRGPRVTGEMVRGLPVACGHTHMAGS
ncbi:hypothetical protein GCM10018966_046140 [Streptomyces yanii]